MKDKEYKESILKAAKASNQAQKALVEKANLKEEIDNLFNTDEIMRAGRTKADILTLITTREKRLIERIRVRLENIRGTYEEMKAISDYLNSLKLED